MDLTNENTRMSYSLGMDIGASFKNMPFPVDTAALIEGFNDAFAGKKPQITAKDFNETMQRFQAMMRDAAQAKGRELSEKNKKFEAEFLAKNKNEKDIVTTASGLQYKVITQGSGKKPAKTSVVKVHYTGKLPDGTIFDSSVQRGEPATFPLNQVIAGWTEALQLMNVGSKHLLYIPANLAYGSRGAGQMIGPDQMLIFEVELLDIVQ